MQKRAFTIIELLVVVSIIALLVGILLPAIGKARDQAKLTQSQGNLKNLATAAVTYAAEYGDRQVTYCNDNLASYGTGDASMTGYFSAHGSITGVSNHPSVIFGLGSTGAVTYGYFFAGAGANGVSSYLAAVPADYGNQSRFGAFRFLQSRAFTPYINNKFFDPVFYAPKDTAVMASVDSWMDRPEEFPENSGLNPKWSSYCFSPAAMVSPDVLGFNSTSNAYYNNPWGLAAGWRSPSMSQAAYPDLKTHIIEHHWLQNRRRTCNPAFPSSANPPPVYDGCQPYFYNGSRESAPVTVYYDGHIGNRGQRDSIDGDARVSTQTQGQPGGAHGLWTRSTPWGGAAGAQFPADGYYQSAAIDTTNTSYHMLTIDGIKGRDFLSK